MTSYTHLYSGAYGSEEIQVETHPISGVTVSPDGLSVYLKVDGLRALYVHELQADGVRSAAGAKLDHADAYYTLNHIPKK